MESISPQEKKVDLNRAEGVTPEVLTEIHNLFDYKAWNADQHVAGNAVRHTLAAAYEAIVAFVPACPQRTRALNMLVDARMLANSAVTHKGRY